MGKSSQYNHYMQRLNDNGQVTSPQWTNIEETFSGLLYEEITGLNDFGKTKNIYTEDYAESDRLRVYLPSNDDYANESTTIYMKFFVVGSPADRQNTINSFLDYVRKGIHRYYDDARNREFDFIVIDEIKVSEERWHGSDPYVEITLPMKNLSGKTRQH